MDRKRIFKFRYGNENDFDSLYEDYLWFSDFQSLNDPFEGYVQFDDRGIDDELRLAFLTKLYSESPRPECSPEEEAMTYYREYEKDRGTPFSEFVDSRAKEYFKKFHKEHRDSYFVLSLSRARDSHQYPSPLNSMQMWSHYANGFKGYCIEFDLDQLKESFNEKLGTKVGSAPVTYPSDGGLPMVNLNTFMNDHINGRRDSSSEILKGFKTKEPSWSFESEIRLISSLRGKHYYDPACINAVYIAEKMPEWAKLNITSALNSKRADINVIEVKMHPSKYELGYFPESNN
ncbi:MAG: hypothetical protein ACI8SR_000061 [Oceanicoccus sp.]|jgi:hypothetical protein